MDYKIIVGGPPDADLCHCFQFNYRSVKNITLLLQEDKLSIECKMKAKKNADQIFTDSNNHFSEALKKGMLFHLLLYSKPLSTENIRIYINDEELDGWKAENRTVIFSLIQKELEPGLPPEWKDAGAVFQYFCKNHESQQKDIAASLYALLYAKTRQNETERFMYLWMSMNGLYNRLAKLKSPDLKCEKGKMQVLEHIEGWGREIVSGDNRERLVNIIENLFRKYGFETEECRKFLSEKLAEFPSKEKPYDLNLDGYLNLCYPYFLRCELFHGNQPLTLFALKNEFEIRCLQHINKRLETYLEHNLFLYFDENYCKERLGLSGEVG